MVEVHDFEQETGICENETNHKFLLNKSGSFSIQKDDILYLESPINQGEIQPYQPFSKLLNVSIESDFYHLQNPNISQICDREDVLKNQIWINLRTYEKVLSKKNYQIFLILKGI